MSVVKQFKRIGAAGEAVPLVEGEFFMTLGLSESVALKLEAKAQHMSRELGFDVTHEQVIAHLLRDVIPAEALATIQMDKEAEELMRQGRKIDAIKLVRSRTALGLKEAKDYVEQKWEHVRPRT